MCSFGKSSTPSGRKFQANLGIKVVCNFSLQARHSILDCKSGGDFKDHPRSTVMKCLLGKALSPTFYFLLAILQILQYCCNAEAGNIEIAPVTQHANLSQSDYARFYCRATGSNTLWDINGDVFESKNHTMNGYLFSEVVVIVGVQADLLVHDMFLDVPTTKEYNTTMIRCAAFVDTQVFSEVALLIVQGGPGAPDPVLTMVNTSFMELEWEAPFTWPHTNIHHYTISANTSQNWNHTDYTDNSLQIRLTEGLAECAVYTFTITANNELADGVPGTVTGGFPIAPKMPADPITGTVTFTSNQQPIIQLNVELPVICAYQQVHYQLTVTGPRAEVLYDDGPRSRFYGNGEAVTLEHTVEDFLNINLIHVTAIFELNTSKANLTAYRNFSVMINPVMGGTVSEGSEFDTEQVVLIAAVGGALLLIAVIFIVVLATVCAYKRRGRFRAGGPKSSPMVTNPIYEGQSVYETIDPHFRPISFTSSHSLPPPTPTSSRPLIESPYAHSQVDPSYASPQLQSMEEEYTVMSSAAGGFTKVSSLSQDSNLESNLDRRSSDMARYVPEPSMLASEC